MHKCKICNSDLNYDTLVIENVPDQTFHISNNTTTLFIKKCNNCKSVQQVNLPYGKDIIPGNFRSIGFMPEYRKQKKEELKNFIESYSLKNSSFIEIGCGDGQYLDIFKELGIKSHGYEINPINVSNSIQKGHTVSSELSILYERNNNKKYDVVTCFYFFEHIYDPKNFLGMIYNLMHEKSILLIEVPNYGYIEDHGLWEEFTSDHLFYYNIQSLEYLLSLCGLRIIELNDFTLCLRAIVEKVNNFKNIRNKMSLDIDKFNSIIKDRKYDIVGAGHYTQLLLNRPELTHLPENIYDLNKSKIGHMLAGSFVLHQGEIVNCDSDLIIISCGAYNREAEKNIRELVPDKEIVVWE